LRTAFAYVLLLPLAVAAPRVQDETEERVLTAGLKNPAMALRDTGRYLKLPFGRSIFEAVVREAPDEAVAVAAGDTPSGAAIRDGLSASQIPEFRVLLQLATDRTTDLPTRRRMGLLAGPLSRGTLTFPAAARLAGDTSRYFAALADARLAAAPGETSPLDRALDTESRVLCQAAAESGGKALPRELAAFRPTDLYLLLALGRTEAGEPVFAAVFDRLLLPKLRAERPAAASLLQFLKASGNWELRDFAAAAVVAHRIEPLVKLIGSGTVAGLAAGIDRTADPQKEAIRLAEIIDATDQTTLLERIAGIVLSELARCSEAGSPRARLLYGLLAARLSQTAAATPELRAAGSAYLPYLVSADTLELSALCGEKNECLQRYYFYDDGDGVESFESFRSAYARDPKWTIEDAGTYVRIGARGPSGRRVEIFANVPIDIHLPANRARDGESGRRQQIIAEVIERRGAVPAVIVHRGHSFYTATTVKQVTPAARLVILGSCGGVSDIHTVIAASHEAQVIATRGIGTTEINDALLKSLNDFVLSGAAVIEWSSFWRDQAGRLGRHPMFRDYVAPNREPSAVFLRAYYRMLDAERN
jgi:hypothetical protein